MIGIVAEGPADIAVVRNILKGKLGIDRDRTFAIRPELAEDATDRARKRGYQAPSAGRFSNWELVLEECRARTSIADFLSNPIEEEEHFVVVHIDTAEAHRKGYDVARPDRKSKGYCAAPRALVHEKLVKLLGPEVSSGVRFAIAVEETDAWLLTIHETQDRRDTGARPNPKARLDEILRGTKWKRGGQHDPLERYSNLSVDFRKRARLEACADRNDSLRLFVDSLKP